MTEITEDDKEMDALLGKIKSKMDVTKFFAGFFTVFVGFSSKELTSAFTDTGPIEIKIAAWTCAIAGIVSVALTFNALSALDTLLMPRSLWVRKEQCTKEYLCNEMKNVWNRLYAPSVNAIYIAILSLLYVISKSILLTFCGLAAVIIVKFWSRETTKHQEVF